MEVCRPPWYIDIAALMRARSAHCMTRATTPTRSLTRHPSLGLGARTRARFRQIDRPQPLGLFQFDKIPDRRWSPPTITRNGHLLQMHVRVHVMVTDRRPSINCRIEVGGVGAAAAWNFQRSFTPVAASVLCMRGASMSRNSQNWISYVYTNVEYGNMTMEFYRL